MPLLIIYNRMSGIQERKNLEFCEKTLELKNDIEKSFIVLGEHLHRIYEEKLYEGQWESFQEYVDEFKNLSYQSAMKLIAIYQKFVLDYKFAPERIIKAGGWTVLATLLPVVKNKTDAEKWLHQAEHNTRKDLSKEVHEIRTGVEMKNCKHKDTYKITVCRECGDRWSDHESTKPKLEKSKK